MDISDIRQKIIHIIIMLSFALRLQVFLAPQVTKWYFKYKSMTILTQQRILIKFLYLHRVNDPFSWLERVEQHWKIDNTIGCLRYSPKNVCWLPGVTKTKTKTTDVTPRSLSSLSFALTTECRPNCYFLQGLFSPGLPNISVAATLSQSMLQSASLLVAVSVILVSDVWSSPQGCSISS